MVNLGNDWDKLLAEEFRKDYYLRLWKFLEGEYRSKPNAIYPKQKDIFKALRATSYEQTKVVIIGQDPYYNKGEATGLAFSVPENYIELPDSLKNIFAEIRRDIKCPMSETNGDLMPWARQGVLLLNTVMTVVHGIPNSHASIPSATSSKRENCWRKFTIHILKELNKKDTPVVFLLWGDQAKKLGKAAGLKDRRNKKVLETAHPSPMANIKVPVKNRFVNCKHFSKTNKFLESKGLEAIDWQIPNAK